MTFCFFFGVPFLPPVGGELGRVPLPSSAFQNRKKTVGRTIRWVLQEIIAPLTGAVCCAIVYLYF